MRVLSLALVLVVWSLAACGSAGVVNPPPGAPPGSSVDAGGGGPDGPTSIDPPADFGSLPPSEKITTANPLLSRHRPITSSAGPTTMVDGQPQPITSLNDGAIFCCDGFHAPTPSWVAIDLGRGPTRVMVTWLAHGATDQPSHQPIDYHLDVSPDGNTWTTRATVTGNDVNAREDAIDFTGQQFMRLSVTKAEGDIFELVELEAFDIAHGSDDTWMFIGDSITGMAMSPNRFTELLHKAHPGFTPMMIGAGIGGTQTTSALTQIDTWIARFPDVRNFGVGFGTNDSGCDLTGQGVDGYISRLKIIIDKLKAANKRVLVPHIPWNEYCNNTPTLLAPYNAAIDNLRAQDPFLAGPDLYTYFAAHPDQLDPDHVHPNDNGIEAINQQWAAAAAQLY